MIMWLPGITQAHILVSKLWRSKSRGGKLRMVAEVLLPVIFLGILGYISIRARKQRTFFVDDPEERDLVRDVLSVDITHMKQIHVVYHHNEFDYAKEITDLMQYILTVRKNDSFTLRKFKGALNFTFYPNEKALEEAHKKNPKTLLFAIVFHKKSSLSYTIRTNPDSEETKYIPGAYPDKTSLDTCRKERGINDIQKPEKCPINAFFYSGFLALQYLIDQSFIKLHAINKTETNKSYPSVTLQNYPKHEYQPEITQPLRYLVPMYISMCFFPFIASLLGLMLSDKESKVKDGLKMIGVCDFAFWLSYFELYLALAGFVSTGLTIVIRLTIIKRMSFMITFCLTYIYGISLITFSFILTAIFRTPGTAASASFYLLAVLSFLHVIKKYMSKQSASYLLFPARLISPVAFTLAIETAYDYEYIGGIEWKDLMPKEKGEPIFWSFVFIAIDVLVYAVFASYLDNLMSNEYGVKEPPLFCLRWVLCCRYRCCRRLCTHRNNLELRKTTDSRNLALNINYVSPKSRWCCNCCCASFRNPCSPVSSETEYYDLPEDENIEEAPENLKKKCAIRLRDIRKTYSSRVGPESVFTLNGISMDIYYGQITAILGRNGVGKTTLINILTGGLAATSGKCEMFGLELTDPFDVPELRRMTGVCMQQDLHFDYLTVSEHLEFYGELRGLETSELTAEIQSLLTSLQLVPQKDERVGKLSIGIRRKLSVAVALIGSPRFILLDEPSTGVDALTRRNIWSVLQSRKRSRVILLTTHFMDEADILADRKGIIHDGMIKCMGSSLFLKRKFGIGYHLTVQVDGKSGLQKSDSIVSKYVPESISTREISGTEASYRLPQYRVEKFGTMFQEFETFLEVGSKGITDYGISLTTLEEVFLKIASDNFKLDSDESTEVVEPMPHRQQRESIKSITSDTDDSNEHEHSDNNSETIVSEPEPHKDEPPPREENVISNLIPFHEKLKPSQFLIFFAMIGIRVKILTRSHMVVCLLVVLPILTVFVGCLWFKLEVPKVKENVTLSVGKGLFTYKPFRIAYSDGSEKRFKNFLQGGLKKLTKLNYSGIFRELLDFHEDVGTAAAFAVGAPGVYEYNMRTNGTYLFSPILALNLLNQFHFHERGATGNITITHYPFHSRSTVNIDTSSNALIFMGAVFVYTANALIADIVKDRESNVRNQLRVNGMPFFVYIVPIIFVYFFVALINVGFQLMLVFAFGLQGFTNFYAATTMAGLLIISIIPTLLFTTTFSYLFETSGAAMYCLFNFSFVGSCLCHVVRELINAGHNVPKTNVKFVSVACSLNVFYIPYAILTIIIREDRECRYLENCHSLGFKEYWKENRETMALVIVMSVQTVVFYITSYFGDYVRNGGLLPFLTSIMKARDLTDGSLSGPKEDVDVTVEKVKAAKFFRTDVSISYPVLVGVQNLWKSYPLPAPIVDQKGIKRLDKEVLQGATFLVEKGELFGLLGHNGAGKTTVMKMLTGETFSEGGKVRVGGYDITRTSSPAFKVTGYCNQIDGFWDNITLLEHIQFFMTVRGVPKRQKPILLERYLKGLQIEDHVKKKPKKLSGGTKRKLSYCLSIIGSPTIALLDEPSTGMDITSKRFLWNTLLATFKEDHGVILATHAMDEADALCTRIGIIVNGALVCIGNPRYLKQKFGAGYTMEVKVKAYRRMTRTSARTSGDNTPRGSVASLPRGSVVNSASPRPSVANGVMALTNPNRTSLPNANERSGSVATLDSDAGILFEAPADKFLFLQKLFPTAKMAEEFGNHVIYLLPKSDTFKLSDAFDILQSLKDTEHIEDYSFSQTTLEQVFIQFSKDHEEEETETKGA